MGTEKIVSENYLRAQEFIRDGKWTVYPELGVLVSKHTGRPLKPGKTKDGYSRIEVNCVDTKKMVHVSLARVVWEYVNGSIPWGLEINHISGNKKDNTIINLELATPKENAKHALDTGLRIPAFGEKHWNSKLTVDDILIVRAMLKDGTTQQIIADKFGVSRIQIQRIASGVRWKHVL